MDSVKATRERDQLRRVFSRNATQVENKIKTGDLDVDADMEYLENKLKSIAVLDKIIQDTMLKAEEYNEAETVEEFDKSEQYQKRFLEIKTSLAKAQNSTTNSSSSSSRQTNIKLPKLEIRKFDDNPKNWLSFWAQFKKIHEDPNLDEEDKYQYLTQAMEQGSAARNLVESYLPTKGNYQNVVNILKNRFAKDDVLIEIYVRELLKLVVCKNKVKVDIVILYDKIVANLQTLETLGILKDKYECMLYPLIESALPDNILLNWSRVPHSDESKLSQLLKYLKDEVEAEERLKLAKTDFLGDDMSTSSDTVPTAACLVTKEIKVKPSVSSSNEGKDVCYFCDKSHNTAECGTANKLSLDAKKEAIKKKGGCYICLKKGHLAKQCKTFISCLCCKKRHLVFLCPTLHDSQKESAPNSQPETEKKEIINNFSSNNNNTTILLQTLVISVSNGKKTKKVRALLDSGSQRTYVKESLVEELNLQVEGKESLGHSLFGGVRKPPKLHRLIRFQVSNLKNDFKLEITGIEQSALCGELPKIQNPTLLGSLQKQNINITDTDEQISEISILIGSDYLGAILESNMVQVADGLVALKTKLGWVLQGPVQGSYSNVVSSHFVTTVDSLEFMWNIEMLGIKDQKQDMSELEMIENFNKNISVTEDGRYEASLIWKLGHPELEPNYDQVYKRLLSTTKKLEDTKKIKDYHEIFQEWKKEGIIEIVENDNKKKGHYLPHHAVIKMESSTTKIRPVFDASAKDKKNNSLNSCIEKGPNLIEVIPKLLILFRAGAYGVISDIRKAFLQISVCNEDRGNLKMLWWDDPKTKKEIVTYQHARVPFGVACSPFLLAATINHHLEKQKDAYPETANRLKNSFYVDNCVTSFDTLEEAKTFIREATELMKKGKFDLRGWLMNSGQEKATDESTPVLGLLWNKGADDLRCRIDLKNKPTEITKRGLLSITQQVFDPMSFVCPVTLIPKLIIQKVWLLKTDWDEKIPQDLEKEYKDWIRTVDCINECKVPRRLTAAPLPECETSVHVFCDASKDAYAGCVFLRTNHDGQVNVQLVIAKNRVAPIKRSMSLPRLELMGALIASRLYTEVLRSGLLSPCKEFKVYCWTDSSVVLAWLKRENTWKTFISNRVEEICKNTNKEDWNHLPGIHNPADLPSRGCSAKTLLEKHWWTGPQWLYLESEHWPKSSLSNLEIDEALVSSEQTKNLAVNVEVLSENFSERLMYFNRYSKIVRLVGRLLRMSPRIRKKFPMSEQIGNEEYRNAERTLIILLQKEHFTNQENIGQKLLTVKENDIIKVKTRLEFSKEDKDFIFPILLPGKNDIIVRMVKQKHKLWKHAGTQTMMSNLREKFWIVGIRRLVKKVVSECIICRRYKTKHYETHEPPLPLNRVAATGAFEVTGIDLAGPLFLKNNTKCWIVLFTCAVYRAIHLELTDSLSTASFIMTLRRFIARRGRIRIIYTDNGTNFVGTANLLKEINWQEVETATNCYDIQWKFSVPLAPWWGGWWERLIRVVKDMLRRILGRAVLDWIELSTVICDCEAVINNRPLTYVEMGELKPLTPMMFLHSLPTSETPDLDEIDSHKLNVRYRYLQKLREDFRKRFRSEYLGLLTNKGQQRKNEPRVGDIVLIGTDSSRLKWPLGLVKEIFQGKDGCTRVAKVQTAAGERVRAYQSLYPLELTAVSEEWRVPSVVPESGKSAAASASPPPAPLPTQSNTRSGRAVRLPSRFLE